MKTRKPGRKSLIHQIRTPETTSSPESGSILLVKKPYRLRPRFNSNVRETSDNRETCPKALVGAFFG